MEYHLIRALKNSPLVNRRRAAIELARDIKEKLKTIHTKADVRNADFRYLNAAFNALVRMVEGGRKSELRGSDYQDALYGIEALEETGTTRALDYLVRKYIAEIKEDKEGFYLDFPNAPPPLRKRLSETTHFKNSPTYNGGIENVIENMKRTVRTGEPHYTLSTAIAHLRERAMYGFFTSFTSKTRKVT